MRIALGEARKALGQTSPNPAVGAVLVIGDRVVARGHHRGAGFPHAEIECLRNFEHSVPKEATLYVTLEPCSTKGRTPACTGQIINAGVSTVVVGAIDPNPRHSGKGIQLLRNAGIEVRNGILETECALINEAFNKWIVTGRPFVVAKCGMTLDGKLTRPAGESGWITSPPARGDVHKLRSQVDAVLIGAETLRKDNPRLTVRPLGKARQPLRVIITRSNRLPRRSHIFTDQFADKTLVFANKSLDFVLRSLGKKEVTSVLVEGGGDVLGQLLDRRQIDKIQVYLGPIITGGPTVAYPGRGAATSSQATKLNRIQFQRLGNEVRVTGYPIYPDNGKNE